MGFRFAWYDDAKTVMHYIAEGDWNWNDYHTCVRASLFSMHNHDQAVDALIDLRGSTRDTLPSGATAHSRTFGKKQTPALTGRAIVIGMKPDNVRQLSDDGQLATRDGVVHFIQDESELHKLLDTWREDENA